ncbi:MULTISPECIES: hypothetical protein [unclassified Streptomyces]|uniref:hypothetical protein n=1 Tax=Streptomyces TaxID=1883 RepID=UPI00081B41C3|nr:hypothetical protein [Streptomyces sp. BvitLS-983]MYX88411.1 hypothetical protein [Streptomyces sp. SID4915]SCE16499.1 hypothetical protein GA0115250_144739 [Streptomyces sp. BvitLS-983]
MSDNKSIAERFARDTANHQMTVKREDGLYRHLRFENPKHGSFGAFELITWPYNLVAKTGWTFHFDIDATEDIFEVFRRTSFPGEINPSYWQEKVRAGRDEIEGYSDELLKQEIENAVQQWVVESPAPEAFERKLRDAVNEHFFGDAAEYNIEYESEAHRALSEFTFGKHYKATCLCGVGRRRENYSDAWLWRTRHLKQAANIHPEGVDPVTIDRVEGYQFSDWHEWRLKDYTPGYLRTCHAIRRGVDLYDTARERVAA